MPGRETGTEEALPLGPGPGPELRTRMPNASDSDVVSFVPGPVCDYNSEPGSA